MRVKQFYMFILLALCLTFVDLSVVAAGTSDLPIPQGAEYIDSVGTTEGAEYID